MIIKRLIDRIKGRKKKTTVTLVFDSDVTLPDNCNSCEYAGTCGRMKQDCTKARLFCSDGEIQQIVFDLVNTEGERRNI